MDPTFNDTATYAAPHKSPEDMIAHADHDAPMPVAIDEVDDMEDMYDTTNDAQEVPDLQASAGSDSDHGMSVDSNSSGHPEINAHEPSSLLSHYDTADHAPARSTSDVIYAPDNAENTAELDDDLYRDDAVGNVASVPTQPHMEAQQPQSGLISASTITPSGKPVAVNLQALLDNLSASAGVPIPTSVQGTLAADQPDPHTEQATTNAVTDSAVSDSIEAAARSPVALPPAAASLPPRPPKLETPANYSSEVDTRQYTNDQNPLSAGFPSHLATSLTLPGSLPPPQPSAGAPGTTQVPPGLPQPPLGSFPQYHSLTLQQPLGSPSIPNDYRQRDLLDTPRPSDDGEAALSPETQQLFDAFLAEERNYESRGQWDKFAPGSRLFLGNVPSEIVTKKDIFAAFHKYGAIAQISIKKAYGFVQFLDATSCDNAWRNENGVLIRGRKINLEIANTQGSRRDKGVMDNRNRGRRSQSPDSGRGGGTRGDRYRGQGTRGQRNGGRGRDDYRPGRSPSPHRARDGYRARSPDAYNGRRRSRSRSPQSFDGRRRSGNQAGFDDDCPLPRRDPRDVPDIQIIAKDNPDRTFISYVEKAFEARGVKADVLLLSSKLSEATVVRRQILEGVLAVMKLDRMAQISQRFNLSVFNRSAGVDNVRFDEYANQDLTVCVELVLRAKQTARPAAPQFNPAAAYAVSQYGIPITQVPAAAPSQAPPIYGQQQPPVQQQQPQHTAFPSMDSSTLQQLLGRVQQQPQPASTYLPPLQFNAQQQQQQQQPLQLPTGADLSRLFATANSPTVPVHQQPQQQQIPNLGAMANTQNWASLLANAQQRGGPQLGQQGLPLASPQQPGLQGQMGGAMGQSQPTLDMNNIMAQLARYGR